MLNELHTMQSPDLTKVNEILREVYVNDILRKKLRILYEDMEAGAL